MATKRHKGKAAAVAQESTIEVTGTWAADDVATITINGKAVSFTVVTGETDIADVVAGLVDAFNAAEHAEFQEITAYDQSPDIRLVGDTLGRPFTSTTSETTAGNGELGDPVEDVAATGPNHWDNALNWDTGSLPVDGDDVVLDEGSSSILYGLAQSAITLTSLTVTQGFLAAGNRVGLPETNVDDGGNPYPEYRDQYLRLGVAADANPTTITIGEGDGSGSGQVKIDSGDSQVTLNVVGSGQPEGQSSTPAVLWKGTHASNVVNVTKGSVGIGYYGEASTVATLQVGFQESQAGDSVVVCGDNVTLTTIVQSGGRLTVSSNVTTATVTGGELVFEAGTMTTLNLDAGAVRYKSTGTLTTANVGSGGNLDFRRDMRGRTVTNLNLYERAEYHDPGGTVTVTNGFDFVRCTPADLVAFDIVPHRTLTMSTI